MEENVNVKFQILVFLKYFSFSLQEFENTMQWTKTSKVLVPGTYHQNSKEQEIDVNAIYHKKRSRKLAFKSIEEKKGSS